MLASMSSLALYRKYRPQTFNEVIGQEHVTTPLIAALRRERLSHAYLFSGPRGCGKTSSARILARSLNCAKGPTPHPCGECESCRALAADGAGSLDVIEIDAASHGGVDDARELRERAFFAPVSSRYKIYIIDEAHMVSSAGFNALLKLVEEPPEFVKFIFATTEPEKVLQTIRSRTHHYPFRLVPPSVLREYLEELCVKEGAAVESTVLPLVVRAGGGSVRDCLSILDQLIAGADENGLSYRRAVSLLGVTDGALLDEACEALAAADGGAFLTTVDRAVDAGHDPRRFASDLLERLRDLLILDKVPDAGTKGIIDVPGDQLERMTGHALRLGSAAITRMADILHDAVVAMRGTTSARLLLELSGARMLLPTLGADAGAILQRLERLERRLDIASTVSPPARMSVVAAGSAPLAGSDVQLGVSGPSPSSAAQATPADFANSGVRQADSVSGGQASGAGFAPGSEVGLASVAEKVEVLAAAVEVGSSTEVASSTINANSADETSARSAVASDSAAGSARAGGIAAQGAEGGSLAEGRQRSAADPAPGQRVPPAVVGTPGQVGIDQVRHIWPEILERLKRRRVVWSLMQNSTPIAVRGDELVLSVQHQGLVRRLLDDTVAGLVRETLRDVLGVDWRLAAEVTDGGPPSVPRQVSSDERSPDDEWSLPASALAPEIAAQTPDGHPVPVSEFDVEEELASEPDVPSPVTNESGAGLALLEQALGARKVREFEV